MENRIGSAAPSRTATTQADEALRRSRAADDSARDMLARRAGLQLLRGLTDLTRNLPHPHGTTLRVTVTVIDSGEDLGSVDVDATNASDLGFLASRRDTSIRTAAPAPAPTGRPSLRLVGGGR
jgi:hypothetical protein